jgi:hypothetical protein
MKKISREYLIRGGTAKEVVYGTVQKQCISVTALAGVVAL